MPIKGSVLKNGPRHNVVNKEFHKRFLEETGMEVSYEDFVKIIYTSNELIRNKCISNNQGFKMPETLGYVAVSRYKPKPGTRSIDWKKSREAGTRVFHTNFHSFGYKAKISWFADTLARCRNMNIYKFVPDRTFTRSVSANIVAGKVYNEYNYESFKVKKIRLGKFNQDGI